MTKYNKLKIILYFTQKYTQHKVTNDCFMQNVFTYEKSRLE